MSKPIRKLYLAGPMRGYPLFNFPAFNAAAAALRAQGYEVWSPAEHDVELDGFNPLESMALSDDTMTQPKTLSHYMERDLPAVCQADAVACLIGWEKSQGANLEVFVARSLGKPVIDAWSLTPISGNGAVQLHKDHVVPALSSKPSNPKDMIGSDKLPLHLWPETATAMGCLGLLDGMLKYGRSNWREVGVRFSIYVDALKRHVNALFEGEDTDPDSGLPHEAHALACLAILIDAKAAGKLTDDRQVKGGYRDLVQSLTPHVARLKSKHADKNTKHYTIADNCPITLVTIK